MSPCLDGLFYISNFLKMFLIIFDYMYVGVCTFVYSIQGQKRVLNLLKLLEMAAGNQTQGLWKSRNLKN